MDVTEEEAYDEIEDRLGILALRLGYKPKGMELKKVYIDENMGEVQMGFYYENSILRVYENKQNDEAVFDAQFDGEVIDSVDLFHYTKQLNILEIDGKQMAPFYATELKYGNAYYHIVSNSELDFFKEIIQGIFFEEI